MGTNIHGLTESRKNGTWTVVEEGPFFNSRNYSVFGFIANVRNYSETPSLQYCRGLPEDISLEAKTFYENEGGGHSTGWLTLQELLDFNYNTLFYDMRVMRSGNGAARAMRASETHRTSYREFLGSYFFSQIEELKKYGDPKDVRVIFWFDS